MTTDHIPNPAEQALEARRERVRNRVRDVMPSTLYSTDWCNAFFAAMGEWERPQSFFAALTPEQQKVALSYRGPEDMQSIQIIDPLDPLLAIQFVMEAPDERGGFLNLWWHKDWFVIEKWWPAWKMFLEGREMLAEQKKEMRKAERRVRSGTFVPGARFTMRDYQGKDRRQTPQADRKGNQP